jgi:hypothetical protein
MPSEWIRRGIAPKSLFPIDFRGFSIRNNVRKQVPKLPKCCQISRRENETSETVQDKERSNAVTLAKS